MILSEKMGLYDEALQYFRKAMELNPYNERIYSFIEQTLHAKEVQNFLAPKFSSDFVLRSWLLDSETDEDNEDQETKQTEQQLKEAKNYYDAVTARLEGKLEQALELCIKAI